MNRIFLMRAHALLAAFILPVAVMFVVTGALYTWGQKGSYHSADYSIELKEPLEADLSGMTELTRRALDSRSTQPPRGEPRLKTYGDHFLLEWTGSARDVLLEPTDDPLVAKLTIKETTWYRSLVQLHKAKGGTLFKAYAVIFAVALLMILTSGFIMAWKMPQLRRASLVAALLGLISFLIAVYFS